MGRLASAARAPEVRAIRAPSIYADANGWRAPAGNSQLASTIAIMDRAPQARGVT